MLWMKSSKTCRRPRRRRKAQKEDCHEIMIISLSHEIMMDHVQILKQTTTNELMVFLLNKMDIHTATNYKKCVTV